MALSDLMKKGFLTSVTATPATVATLDDKYRPTVATVATVAVTNNEKSKYSTPTVAGVAGVAVTNFKNLESASTAIAPIYLIDLVREFMEVDGLTLEEATAMAAISAPVRPAAQWLALIAELDALIERYCLAAGLTGESRSAIVSVRFNQSLASIPESLGWFKREVERMDAANAPPALLPKDYSFEGRASANAARAALYQSTKKEPKP